MTDDAQKPIEDRLAEVNAALAAWTARSAHDSERLLHRLESMGYEVLGRTEEEVAEILRHPPTRS